jgi:hypothetical protein
VAECRKYKQIKECFGWMKDIALMRKLQHRGKNRMNQLFQFKAEAGNLAVDGGEGGRMIGFIGSRDRYVQHNKAHIYF